MSNEESYNGWTNRETWAVNLYIGEDPVWSETRDEAMRQLSEDSTEAEIAEAAKSVTELLLEEYAQEALSISVLKLMLDIGSLYRVNWYELGQMWLDEVEL